MATVVPRLLNSGLSRHYDLRDRRAGDTQECEAKLFRSWPKTATYGEAKRTR